MRGSAIEKAADRLAEFEEAYVVIEGENALRAAKDLRGLLGVTLGSNGAADDLDEDEDEDDLDDEEDDEDEDDLEDEDEES